MRCHVPGVASRRQTCSVMQCDLPRFHFAPPPLQRPIRERPSSRRSTWKKSPKWKRRWARGRRPAPRAKSSPASPPLSASTGQQQALQWQQRPSAHCWSNQGTEARWRRTACWARTSTWRWLRSCWWNFQVRTTRRYWQTKAISCLLFTFD